MAQNLEKLRIVREFIRAQASVSLVALIIFLINQQYDFVIVIGFAAILQWVQLYAWAKPTRVAFTKAWLQGVYTGVALKYILLTLALVALFTLKPNGFYLDNPKQLFTTALVFIAAYIIPYWYAGILSVMSKRKEEHENN